MLDMALAWMVICIPTALGILVIFIPAKEIDRVKHMRWRFVLVGVGIAFSVLVWWQQSRAERSALNERRDAIKETGDKVTRKVSDQYKGTIDAQTQKIGELQRELSQIGNQVSTIRNSNIVSGSKPLKVEVTNPSHPTEHEEHPLVERVTLVSDEQVASTQPDDPFARKLVIHTETTLNPTKISIECDGPVEKFDAVLIPTGGFETGFGLPIKDGVVTVWITSPPFTPDLSLVVHLFGKSAFYVKKIYTVD